MKPIAAIAAAAALAGAVVLSLSGEQPAEVAPAARSAAQPAHAVKLAACPVETGICEDARPIPGGCLCLTTAEALPGEVDTDPAHDPRLWVCPADDDHPQTWTTWTTTPGTPAPGCRLAVPPGRFGGYSMAGVDLGHVEHLRTLCRPCDVQPGAWGPCPVCWFEGDCAARCKSTEPEP